MALWLVSLLFIAIGLAISVLFWVPRVFNRQRMRELLGRRYPLLYFVYVANGPLLVVLGLFLLWRFG
ncbi:MAG TPA: hypothetical protein VLL73_03455 [Desulfurivibrionaceae bacterium]|nr:hypothetical protein [Desulfurivibrionaceae bacterium]